MSFHLEALRRSKILARKKDAQFNLAAKYVEEKVGRSKISIICSLSTDFDIMS